MKKSESEWITTTGYDPKPQLKSALFIWEMQSNTIATLHDWNGDAYINPRPLSKDEMSSLTSNSEPSKMFHPRLLGPRLWWAPKKRRRIKIKNSKRRTFNYPPLVFRVERHFLFVGQLRKNERPTENTKVYKTPFSGTDVHYSKMGACNVRIPTDLNDIEAWEDTFFYSVFNEVPKQKLGKGVKLSEWVKNARGK